MCCLIGHCANLSCVEPPPSLGSHFPPPHLSRWSHTRFPDPNPDRRRRWRWRWFTGHACHRSSGRCFTAGRALGSSFPAASRSDRRGSVARSYRRRYRAHEYARTLGGGFTSRHSRTRGAFWLAIGCTRDWSDITSASHLLVGSPVCPGLLHGQLPTHHATAGSRHDFRCRPRVDVWNGSPLSFQLRGSHRPAVNHLAIHGAWGGARWSRTSNAARFSGYLASVQRHHALAQFSVFSFFGLRGVPPFIFVVLAHEPHGRSGFSSSGWLQQLPTGGGGRSAVP